MKVALIVEWLDGWRGGAETSTRQFIDELVDQDVELEVFTQSHTPSRPGVAVRTMRTRGPSRALKALSFCRQADEAAQACGADVIHSISPSLAAHIYQPRGGSVAETIARNKALRRTQAGRALKHLAQHVNLKQRMLLKLERKMFAADHPPVVAALSDYVVRQFREHYGLNDDHVRKVFNGVAPDDTPASERAEHRQEVRKLYNVDGGDVLALSVAHNFRLKGVHTLIDALTRMRGQGLNGGLKVLVAGKGQTVRWESLVRRRGLTDVVQFIGPTQRIRAFYHAADMLAHPTFYDPCSRVVLEALASGVPCISTRYDGAAEMITDGETGFVLDVAGDADTLCDRMRRMLDPSTRKHMTQQVAVLPPADMRSHAAKMLELYRTIAGGR